MPAARRSALSARFTNRHEGYNAKSLNLQCFRDLAQNVLFPCGGAWCLIGRRKMKPARCDRHAVRCGAVRRGSGACVVGDVLRRGSGDGRSRSPGRASERRRGTHGVSREPDRCRHRKLRGVRGRDRGTAGDHVPRRRHRDSGWRRQRRQRAGRHERRRSVSDLRQPVLGKRRGRSRSRSATRWPRSASTASTSATSTVRSR